MKNDIPCHVYIFLLFEWLYNYLGCSGYNLILSTLLESEIYQHSRLLIQTYL